MGTSGWGVVLILFGIFISLSGIGALIGIPLIAIGLLAFIVGLLRARV